MDLIWGSEKQKYFQRRGWTGLRENSRGDLPVVSDRQQDKA
jgi:hypothetical protein